MRILIIRAFNNLIVLLDVNFIYILHRCTLVYTVKVYIRPLE